MSLKDLFLVGYFRLVKTKWTKESSVVFFDEKGGLLKNLTKIFAEKLVQSSQQYFFVFKKINIITFQNFIRC